MSARFVDPNLVSSLGPVQALADAAGSPSARMHVKQSAGFGYSRSAA